MPLPTPNDGEGHDDFIDRCMSDENVQADADDEEQALAICESQWDNRSEGVTMEREHRFIPSARIEVRAVEGEDGEPAGIEGEGAVFERRTVIAGMFEEEIAPGAFDDVLDDDIVIEFNHDPNFVLGRTASGTASVSADTKAFRYRVDDMPQSRGDVLEAVNRGDVRGSSFSFAVAADGEEWIDRAEEGKLPLRRITRYARVFDTGPVTHPAYEETSVSARARDRAEALTAAEERAVEGADDGNGDEGDEGERIRVRHAHRRRRLELAELELER